MYTYDLAIPEFKDRAAEAIELLRKILADVPAKAEAVKVTPQHAVFTGGMSRDSLFVLREGNVKYERNGRLLYIYEEGDLIDRSRLTRHVLARPSGGLFTCDLVLFWSFFLARYFLFSLFFRCRLAFRRDWRRRRYNWLRS